MLASEQIRSDVALAPQEIDGGNATGAWFQLAQEERGCFVLHCGALPKAATSKLKLRQAKDNVGDGAKDVDDSEITLTGVTKSTRVTLTLATVQVDDEVTINGITFTAKAANDAAARQFINTGNNDAAAGLAAAINDATMGVPGVVAAAAAAVVTVTAIDGRTTITVADDAATITPATTMAIGMVDFGVHDLDLENEFTWVAPLVTNSGTTVSAVSLLRSPGRFNPDRSNIGAWEVV